MKNKGMPWYAGEHKDAFFYLMIAIFLLEMAVGGISFFYGIIHAAPEMEGGPPVARFPWLAWVLAAVLSPVALLLIVHLIGLWVSSTVEKEYDSTGAADNARDVEAQLPEGMRRFYAAVRHAPVIVLFGALLLLGCSLFFVDGALGFLGKFATALVPYIPWIVTSAAALLAICFLAHAILVYRQRKMDNEYAWRREVLERTGLIIVDKTSAAIPQNMEHAALISPDNKSLPEKVFDVTAELPEKDNKK